MVAGADLRLGDLRYPSLTLWPAVRAVACLHLRISLRIHHHIGRLPEQFRSYTFPGLLDRR